ncbi:hypothetical protein [Maricaulis sp.]|uniref:hypothetical protein n=1 Tax=Maricaulis sp. TaxID=1486257 RepID=UPI003A8D6E5D
MNISSVAGRLFDSYFADVLNGTSIEYSWKASERTWDELGTGFRPDPSEDPATQNRALKRHIAQIWSVASRWEKVRLATWVVRDWGGIRANAPETLAAYVDLADATEPDLPIKGVASYSKVLTFTQPEKYAIYDARVAASLLALQLIFVPAEEWLFFTQVAGRNKRIEAFKTRFRQAHPRARGFNKIPKANVYSTYLNLLNALAGFSDQFSIEDFEMVLFAQSEVLCQVATARLDAG